MVKIFSKIQPSELEELQKKIIRYEDKHLGGYIRVFPPKPVYFILMLFNS